MQVAARKAEVRRRQQEAAAAAAAARLAEEEAAREARLVAKRQAEENGDHGGHGPESHAHHSLEVAMMDEEENAEFVESLRTDAAEVPALEYCLGKVENRAVGVGSLSAERRERWRVLAGR